MDIAWITVHDVDNWFRNSRLAKYCWLKNLFNQLPHFEKLNLGACNEGQFSCKDGECVAGVQRCDHVRDCDDGSDELDCSKYQLPFHFLNCVFILQNYNKFSIIMFTAFASCNTRLSLNFFVTKGYACRSPHMKPCKDGHCITMHFFCDGKDDCKDGSDEVNCTGKVS